MPELSPIESALLRLIREDPFAGQQAMAERLGISRPAVAAHIMRLTERGHILGRGYVLPPEGRVIAIGGAVIDRKYLARTPLIAGTSNPVEGMRSFGGVARNVAENLALLGTTTGFVTTIGNDENGRSLLAHLRERGVDVAHVMTLSDQRTAEYAAILEPSGELAYGIADMAIFDRLTPAMIETVWPAIASASLVFADCNLPAETLATLIAKRPQSRFRLAIDAVSTPKVMRLPQNLEGVDLLFLNLDEASAFLGKSFTHDINGMRGGAELLHETGAAAVILSCGAIGVVVCSPEGTVHIPVVRAKPVDMTGAGDAMIAGTLNFYTRNDTLTEAVRKGALIGSLTTETAASVHPDLSNHFVEANLHRLGTTEGDHLV
ncbi:carbohydrate kinase [Martelella radicis]|uniref:Pseudouridine kinase n=1 Tax=Martelella radicis TaxID=1397476 RepID=A0A7W6P7U4_9HYPH|nr:carbohydrate kinase [Martelella radicis]MBB4120532.1 pseudouridine kinase [Martelella radicis]